MTIIPVPLRRLRQAGFTEAQTDALDDALDEASEATAEAARDGLTTKAEVNDHFGALRAEMVEFRQEMAEFRNELTKLRADLNATKWWLYGSLSLIILAQTVVILLAFAVWR